MAQELQNIESIFDFLYLDNIKIKSFYAQLTGEGALSTVKKTNAVSTTEHKEATLGIPTVTGAKLSHTDTPSRGNEFLYDGIPTMPREMIDKLDELGFINHLLNENSAGKLVLLKGQLSITDVGSLKDMIEPAMKQEAEALAQGIVDPNKRKKAVEKSLAENKNIIELIKAIPYALEAHLTVGKDSVWMTLNRDEMVGNPNDLNLKHGNVLFGDYYVLGVLDAIPENRADSINNQNEFKLAMSILVRELRKILGRPESSYGLTPIAIFRVIEPN